MNYLAHFVETQLARPGKEIPLLRLLLIEDDPEARALFWRLCGTLEKKIKVKMEAMPSFEEGRQRLSTQRYDLVIADYHLPGEGTGLDLWRYSKNVGFHIPFMITSGSALKGLMPSVSETFDFLPKPLDFVQAREKMLRMTVGA